MESEKLELPINFGKPSGDLYLDDRAVRFTNWSSRALAAICASCCVPVPRATHRPTDVIITAGGQGSRMGTALPKPLVEVCPGTPMAEHALISLSGLTINTLIIVSNCVADAEHNLGGRIADLAHKHQQQGLYSFDKIVCATEEGQPRGQLTTALCARAHLSNHHGVMILPVDGLVDWRPAQAIAELQLGDTGFLTVIPMQGERWTFARTDEDGVILQVAEKVRISDLAGTGIYFFSDSCQFLYESERTVARGPSPHQEYFVTPMIQEMIRNGARFRAVLVDDFWEFGTRESLLRYGREISRRFITG